MDNIYALKLTTVKIVKTLLLFILIGNGAFAQSKKVSAKDVVNFTLPSGSKELKGDNIKAIKNSHLSLNEIEGSIFKLDNSIMVLTAGDGSLPSNFLKDKKRGFDDLIPKSGKSNYTSSIKSFKNYNVLIVKYDSNDLGYLRFTAVNDKNDKVLGGVIEHIKGDNANIDSMTDNFLNTLSFK